MRKFNNKIYEGNYNDTPQNLKEKIVDKVCNAIDYMEENAPILLNIIIAFILIIWLFCFIYFGVCTFINLISAFTGEFELRKFLIDTVALAITLGLAASVYNN